MDRRSKLLKYSLAGLVIIIIISYSYFQTKNLIRGPVISITYPTTNMTFDKSSIEIRGSVENSSYITMNGRQIFVDEFGKFNELLLLSEGYNIVEIEVTDRFDRKKKAILELVYTKPNKITKPKKSFKIDVSTSTPTSTLSI